MVEWCGFHDDRPTGCKCSFDLEPQLRRDVIAAQRTGSGDCCEDDCLVRLERRGDAWVLQHVVGGVATTCATAPPCSSSTPAPFLHHYHRHTYTSVIMDLGCEAADTAARLLPHAGRPAA
ncbi:hypothetical protein ACFQX7_27740 [Luedemannella flava]